MNPYASEDFNRIRLNPKTKQEQEQVDHPLFEGKKMDISKTELNTFTKAMEKTEFQTLMNEYVNEISDPKHRPEHDQYLREMEERGELPVGTALIQPIAGFCIKTAAKKMVSDFKKQFFDQKTFVNVCWHESIDKPERQEITQPDGKRGTSWGLPYRVSKGKHDQDNTGTVCMTYDVVFNSDVANFLVMADFKKFVADTAIDGVNRTLAENKEKLSADYKIMKHITCKGHGGKPQLMTIKTQSDNPLLNNMDMNKQETKLQKDINKTVQNNKEKLAAEEQAKKDAETSQAAVDADEDERSEHSSEEERPSGIVQPKYKIVHSFPNDLMDAWEGHQGTLEQAQLEKSKKKLPDSLTVTIYAKHCDSLKGAQLDINDSTLVFAVEGLYYLDLNLKYQCNSEDGSAKFDKTKKTLTIRLPVVGLTEDSKRVADQHWAEYLEMEKEREEQYKNLEESTLQQDADKRRIAKSAPQKEGAENQEEQNDQENAGDSQNNNGASESAETNEGTEGVSKKTFLMAENGDEDSTLAQALEDKYTTQIPASPSEGEDKRDATTVQRESFLSIVSDKTEDVSAENGSDEPDLSNGIRFKRETEEDSGFELKTATDAKKKPLIQELDSAESANIEQQRKEREEAKAFEEEKAFDFETAEKTELKGSFIQQTDLVFFNVPAKGYDKDADVRFALHSDEFLLEIRDKTQRGKHLVRRVCKTLTGSIDVGRSEVQLLKDFIVVKLMKQDSSVTWRELGFDISNFTVPQTSQMNSNFLQSLAKEEPEEENKDEQPTEPEKTLEELEDEKRQKVQDALHRARFAAVSFMPMQTESIYEIF